MFLAGSYLATYTLVNLDFSFQGFSLPRHHALKQVHRRIIVFSPSDSSPPSSYWSYRTRLFNNFGSMKQNPPLKRCIAQK